MLGTVPRLSWPKLGAATSRIINVYCRKNVPSRPARYVDMPPLQKAALPETTNCSRYVWLSNTTGNLGPANSHEKRSHGIVAGWFAKEMRNIKFVFPAASDFCSVPCSPCWHLTLWWWLGLMLSWSPDPGSSCHPTRVQDQCRKQRCTWCGWLTAN